jgi:serine/threonine protein phosphatase 1
MGLSSLWTRPLAVAPDRPRIPDKVLVYAVGDIHGRLDLLDSLLAKIEADLETRSADRTLLVFLGDLIDRGPDSSGVIERLRTFQKPTVQPVFLMGNHEEVLLTILEGNDRIVPDWLRFGGFECATSYGVDRDALKSGNRKAIGDCVRRMVPEAHREFLASFADSFRVGNYFFTHAGIRPGIPIDQQSAQDLRWIRSPFLEHNERHPMMVVHGHTICTQVEERVGRIGIDTGAYRSGVLTAIGLQGDDRWYLASQSEAGSI